MKTGQRGVDLIKSFEGFSPVTYLCPTGHPTIGYGHLIEEGETFDEPLTKEDAEELLATDLVSYEQAVMRLTSSPLTSGEFDALVSFVYNLGPGAYAASTLRRLINRGEKADAAEEFPKWVYGRVGGALIKLPGLVRRRNAERLLFLAADEEADVETVELEEVEDD